MIGSEFAFTNPLGSLQLSVLPSCSHKASYTSLTLKEFQTYDTDYIGSCLGCSTHQCVREHWLLLQAPLRKAGSLTDEVEDASR